MSAPVVTVSAETSVHDAARLLLAHGISAAPVVDAAGELIGMVSEGDLIGRNEQERLAGHDWWLTLLAQSDPARMHIDEALRARPVREVMHSPVITAEPGTPLHEIAEMMRVHRIKRLPVMRQGRISGIVSRADLLRVVADLPTAKPQALPSSGMLAALMSLFAAERPAPAPTVDATAHEPASETPTPATSADSFLALTAAARASRRSEREAAVQATRVEEQRRVRTALQQHLDAAIWQSLLAAARAAAERGETEFEMLRFPSAVCSDRGRKIDVGEDGWPETLRGEPAELYDRWERELRPAHFGLAARVMDYPEGRLGDVGLFLTWRN